MVYRRYPGYPGTGARTGGRSEGELGETLSEGFNALSDALSGFSSVLPITACVLAVAIPCATLYATHSGNKKSHAAMGVMAAAAVGLAADATVNFFGAGIPAMLSSGVPLAIGAIATVGTLMFRGCQWLGKKIDDMSEETFADKYTKDRDKGAASAKG